MNFTVRYVKYLCVGGYIVHQIGADGCVEVIYSARASFHDNTFTLTPKYIIAPTAKITRGGKISMFEVSAG